MCKQPDLPQHPLLLVHLTPEKHLESAEHSFCAMCLEAVAARLSRPIGRDEMRLWAQRIVSELART